MARTPSNMVSLGTKAPDFSLFDVVSEESKNLNELKGKNGSVIMFICNHCPYVKHVNKTIVELANKFKDDEVNFIAISSNDVINYPEDSPELMKLNAEQNKFIFPYLYDESQEIAKKYDAACTPDFYLYDNELKLVYRGQLDDSRPGNGIECDGKDLSYAIKCLIKNIQNDNIQKPSIGCNIKWK
jgi:peroxiredoxin